MKIVILHFTIHEASLLSGWLQPFSKMYSAVRVIQLKAIDWARHRTIIEELLRWYSLTILI